MKARTIKKVLSKIHILKKFRLRGLIKYEQLLE